MKEPSWLSRRASVRDGCVCVFFQCRSERAWQKNLCVGSVRHCQRSVVNLRATTTNSLNSLQAVGQNQHLCNNHHHTGKKVDNIL